MNPKSNFLALSESIVFRSFLLLNKKDQIRLLVVSTVQMACSILDLVGVALAGVLGALAIRGVQSQEPGDRVSRVLAFLNIENSTFQFQVMFLALITTSVLLSRTVFTVILSRRTIFFLSNRSARLTSEICAKYFSKDLTTVESMNSQKFLFSVTSGTEIVMIRILGTTANMFTDIASLLLISVGLLLVNPIMFISTFALFGITSITLHYFLNIRVKLLGAAHTEQHIQGNSLILDTYSNYRENFVKQTIPARLLKIKERRMELSRILGEIAFLPSISKYVFEVAALFGLLAIAAGQFFLGNASQAVGVISIFLAAGMRLAPAAMRVQQSIIGIKGASSEAASTIELFETLVDSPVISAHQVAMNKDHEGFVAEVNFEKVKFFYPGMLVPSVYVERLHIKEGATVAIVGKSGSGKSTLVDLLLGVRTLSSGSIQISGMSPRDAIMKFPGSIGYVSQETFVGAGTLEENLRGDYLPGSVTDKDVNFALDFAQLREFRTGDNEDSLRQLGQSGQGLSGGQKQRLGIAKAVLTRPKLLVLDEATSALDAETEFEISEAIRDLRGETTVVIIAHRLSTIKNADLVVYLDAGEIVASGTFIELRRLVPDFDTQVKLMAL